MTVAAFHAGIQALKGATQSGFRHLLNIELVHRLVVLAHGSLSFFFISRGPAASRALSSQARKHQDSVTVTRTSSMLISRIRNFCILPVTVIGKSSTNLKCRGVLK